MLKLFNSTFKKIISQYKKNKFDILLKYGII